MSEKVLSFYSLTGKNDRSVLAQKETQFPSTVRCLFERR